MVGVDSKIAARAKTAIVLAAALTTSLMALGGSVAAAATPRAPRIINGSQVDAAAYTARWQSIVALGETGSSAVSGQFCGGTLIDARLVLTAAHCVTDDYGRTRLASQITVHTGGRDLRSMAESIPAEAVFVHPQWDVDELRYDSAVIRLLSASAQPGVEPVQPGEEALWGDGNGKLASAAGGPWIGGWGSTNADPFDWPTYPDVMREINVPIKSDTVCDTTPYGGQYFHAASQLCAGVSDGDGQVGLPSTGKDSCYGDSGGPILVSDGVGGPWRVAGIVSWGTVCGGPGYGYYGRVAAMEPWIDAIPAASGGPGGLEEPENLVVSNTTIRSHHLAWDVPSAGPAPTSYRIYKLVKNRWGEYYEQLVATTSATERTISGIPPYTRLYLRIRSVDANGMSEPLAAAVRTLPDTTPPARPRRARLLGTNGSRVRIRWRGVHDNHRVGAYRVLVARGSGRYRLARRVSGSTRSLTLRGLSAGAAWRIAIQAVDASGNRSRPGRALRVRTG